VPASQCNVQWRTQQPHCNPPPSTVPLFLVGLESPLVAIASISKCHVPTSLVSFCNWIEAWGCAVITGWRHVLNGGSIYSSHSPSHAHSAILHHPYLAFSPSTTHNVSFPSHTIRGTRLFATARRSRSPNSLRQSTPAWLQRRNRQILRSLLIYLVRICAASRSNRLRSWESTCSYTPELIEPWFKLAFAVTGQKRFTPRERELSILAVLAVYDAPYVLYAHSEIAVVAGLSKDQVQQAVQGKAPDNLSEQEAMLPQFSDVPTSLSPFGLAPSLSPFGLAPCWLRSIRAARLSANPCKIGWSALIWWQLAQLASLTFASHNILVCDAIINAQHVNHNVCELVIVLSHMLYLMRLI